MRHLEKQAAKKKKSRKGGDDEKEEEDLEDNSDTEEEVGRAKTQFEIKQETHNKLKELVEKYAKDDDFFDLDDDEDEDF